MNDEDRRETARKNGLKAYKTENGYWRFVDSNLFCHITNAWKALGLEIHHIDGNTNNNEPWNLLPCRPVHHKGIQNRIKLLIERISELEESISMFKEQQV